MGLEGEILDKPFEMDEAYLPEFLNDNVARLGDLDKHNVEQPFIMEELENCIKHLPSHKAPGWDGIQYEVYKKIFYIIKIDYLNVQNCISERERLTAGMRRSVTRLPPKISDGIPTLLQLRPISMQISDYGIRNKMFAARLSPLMPSLIRSGQLCSHEEKNILFGITNIISSIEYVNKNNLQAAIASYDLDHAFDRAYIPYIVKVFQQMNFGEKFIKMMIDSHKDITTQFILNGLTEAISLTFSFRQGDPISMILYLIYIEPLLVKLGEVLSGLNIDAFNETDNDFCDDVEILVEDEADLLRAEDIFLMFEKFSGAKLNRSHKSKILGIGASVGKQNWPLPWLKVEKSLKIFGIHIYPTFEEILKKNWEFLIAKLKNTIQSWSLRSLDSFQQKVDVLQIFGTSKLWYVCQVLPLSPIYAKQLETIVRKFLWRGKLEKLALDEVKNTREEGGLNLVCIRSKADALFLRQTCRLLSNENFNSFKHINFWIGSFLADMLPTMQAGDQHEDIPDYFLHMRDLFTQAHALEIIDISQLNSVPCKDIYRDFTSTFPPPKVINKYEDLPWNDIWKRLNFTVLGSTLRDLMFMLIHNILPTRDRLARLGRCADSICREGDGTENVEHLFSGCSRTQVAWAWARRKVQHLMPQSDIYPSDFELLHLAFSSNTLEKEIVWLLSHYCWYVWELKKKNNNRFIADVDKLRSYLMKEYVEIQFSQNYLAYIPF